MCTIDAPCGGGVIEDHEATRAGQVVTKVVRRLRPVAARQCPGQRID
jgi:hypothetical protein